MTRRAPALFDLAFKPFEVLKKPSRGKLEKVKSKFRVLKIETPNVFVGH